jgi:hypothetical protein
MNFKIANLVGHRPALVARLQAENIPAPARELLIAAVESLPESANGAKVHAFGHVIPRGGQVNINITVSPLNLAGETAPQPLTPTD